MGILDTVPAVVERDKDVLLLIDADYIVYLVAAITQMKEQPSITSGCTYQLLDKKKGVWGWVEPPALVKWRAFNELEKIKDRFRSNQIEIYLTPSAGNFRDDIAVSRPYKGNRKGAKPYHYHTVRNHLLSEEIGGLLADGVEADDLVSIRQLECRKEGIPCVVVSPDKDAINTPGWHYDPRKDILRLTSPAESAEHFFLQLLTGDSVDNIPGLPGVGKVGAQKIIGGCFAEEWETPEDYIDLLCDAVRAEYERKGHPYSYLWEQANLLHMLRERGDSWSPEYNWIPEGEIDYEIE